jgi:hypothetical protein
MNNRVKDYRVVSFLSLLIILVTSITCYNVIGILKRPRLFK